MEPDGTLRVPSLGVVYPGNAPQAEAWGRTAQAALLSLPTLSTHGYEVLHSGTVDRAARLLAASLARPLPVG